VLYRASESLFYLILGKILDPRSVGLCQRALMLALFPERVVLAGVGIVALPAFSGQARRGGALKTAYLSALEHVTAVQWPALILLAILADPVVALLLGPQWRAAGPLVQIFALALMFNFPTALNYPVQVAVGAIRHTVPLAFVQTAFSLAVLLLVAHHGVRAVALSAFVTVSFNVTLSVLVVRAQIPFSWLDLVASLAKSAGVAGFSAVGPLVVLMFMPDAGNRPISSITTALGLFGIGWLAGLRLTRHKLLFEICQASWTAKSWAAATICDARLRFGGQR
jgi:O-antigen/teichoic acid export membrane protein